MLPATRLITRAACISGLAACISGLAACRVPAGRDRLEQLFSGELTVIDLTHALSPDSPYWPNDSGNPFEYRIIAAHESGKPVMGAYSTPEHHGTHLDAPIHGGDYLATVDQLTASDLFGPAAVVDIAERGAENPDYLLTRDDLLEWEGNYGRIPDGSVVLLYTGWSLKYQDAAAYSNQDEEGRLHFPGFSDEAAHFLVLERSIRGIGIDNLSIDYGLSRSFDAHGIVNGAGKYHLENVANLHLLPPTGAWLIVAPVKIEGGSGGQVRIFAVLP